MLCGLGGSLPWLTAMPVLSGDSPPVGLNVASIVQLELGNAAGTSGVATGHREVGPCSAAETLA